MRELGAGDLGDGREPVTLAQATDPDEAEAVITDLFLPNRLELPPGTDGVAMNLAAARIGQATVGRLSYGRSIRLLTDDARHFHINTPMSGRALSRTGASDPLVTEPGQGAVFAPGAPADIHWTEECVQLCVMIPRATLEFELEQLIRRPLTRQLQFQFAMDLTTPLGRCWRDVVSWADQGLAGRPSLAFHWLAEPHVERLLFDGLLISHQHNYSEALRGGPAPVARKAISQAVDLLHDRPGDPWSSTSLARAVHLSLRSLQEGFKHDLGQPPMAYLRDIRLRRAHQALEQTSPDTTTVQAVASRFGLFHMGRFSAAYRARFEESPSETLRRLPPS
jgi:AraC-like DNA-binding protein